MRRQQLLGAIGAVEQQPRWAGVADHPVLAGVDPMTIDIRRARPYDGDGIVPIATSERGTPLVQIGDRADRRFVMLAFGAADSTLAFAPAFPVLMANAIEWLAHPTADAARRPGMTVERKSVGCLKFESVVSERRRRCYTATRSSPSSRGPSGIEIG